MRPVNRAIRITHRARKTFQGKNPAFLILALERAARYP